MQGVLSNANDINLFVMIFHRMSLHFKLVPVQYREYEYGLLMLPFASVSKRILASRSSDF